MNSPIGRHVCDLMPRPTEDDPFGADIGYSRHFAPHLGLGIDDVFWVNAKIRFCPWCGTDLEIERDAFVARMEEE